MFLLYDCHIHPKDHVQCALFDWCLLKGSRLKNLIIIILEICKAPTLRLKAPNKHSIMHVKCIEMENVISS